MAREHVCEARCSERVIQRQYSAAWNAKQCFDGTRFEVANHPLSGKHVHNRVSLSQGPVGVAVGKQKPPAGFADRGFVLGNFA